MGIFFLNVDCVIMLERRVFFPNFKVKSPEVYLRTVNFNSQCTAGGIDFDVIT